MSGGGHVVAVDAGTSAVKAALVAEDGSITAVERREVAATAGPGQDAMAYWQGVAESIRGLATLGHSIDAVAVAGQGDGLWTVADDGHPAGPAYEWNATLASDVVTDWEADGTIEAHYRASGTVLWPGAAAALWRWLEHNDGEHAQRVAHAFCAKDWINYQLTGQVATDVTDGTIPFLDMATGHYDPGAFDRLGCGALAERMAPILGPGEEVGRVTAAAAAATGLPQGVPVLMGCIDVVALINGAGMTRSGDALVVLGTTAAAMVLTDRVTTEGEPVGAALKLPGPDRYMAALGANSGTSTVDWYRNTIGCTLDELWEDVANGRPGVTLLPYLAGERAPFLAPDATGAFLGITPNTGRPDLARAVVHGVTYSLRHCLDAALPAGQAGRGQLVLTGGGASSAAWCQLVADVTQRPVRVDDRAHVACAGVAALVTGSTPQSGELMTYAPEADHTDEYRAFVDLGQQLRPVWSSMRKPQHRSDR